MDREVASLRQTTGGMSARDLEAMLGALSGAPLPQGSATGVEYVQGELRIKGLGLDAEQAEQVAASLAAQGYTATLQGELLVITKGGT
jgi:general secretion pathway protein L